LQRWQHLLTLLSPQHWLERGFVLLRNRNDRLITAISEVELGEEVNLELADGKLSAQITGAAPRDATTQAQQH